MTQTAYTTDILSGPSGSFSASVSSLAASTTYYYKAYMTVWNGTEYVDIESSTVGQFTTAESVSGIPAGWLELPATTGSEDYVGSLYGSGGATAANRNYSYNYSYTWYSSLWVAYPLTKSHTSGSASTSSWKYNPDIDKSRQVNVTSNSYPSMYNADGYSKGHQCPNADRKSDDTMNAQTYYVTNQTPQRQNNFNGSIWGSLETATRTLVSSTDTVYVVTGPAYRKVGGSESITYLTGASGKGASPSTLAVPNYYWKVLLKVKWSGSGSSKTVKSASAIGFWFEHKDYDSKDSYTNYAVSVSTVEAYTGFDFFTNLPESLKSAAKSNTSWTTFKDF